LPDESNINLSKYRLSSAKEDYQAAYELVNNGHFRISNNRAYYTIFHCMRAVLAIEGIDFKKHSAVIAYFNQHYIKTGKFDNNLYRIIADASYIRNESDYSDFYIASKEDSLKQLENAKFFLESVDRFLKNVYENLV